MRVLLVLLLVSAAPSAGGCVPDYGYVSVESAPYNYAMYPRAYYDGAPAYFIDGRWYTRRHEHWGYFREEPPELHRSRRYVEQAPPAYPHHRYEHERQSAPPAREVAPPAERVR